MAIPQMPYEPIENEFGDLFMPLARVAPTTVKKLRVYWLGGAGSGNFGHGGRPGEVGGSAADGEEAEDDEAGSEPKHTGKDVRTKIAPALAKVAQEVYDKWDESDVDCYAGGGICHFIAEEMAGALQSEGIEANTVSQQIGEQHVYVVAKLKDGVYAIDIPPSTYETGGGYSWKKIPDVAITKDDIVVDKIDGDPDSYGDYIEMADVLALGGPNALVRDAPEAPKHLGGAGSGNFGHTGRPGEVGGSAEGSGDRVALTPKERDDAFMAKWEDQQAREKELEARGAVPYAHSPKSRAEMVQKRKDITAQLKTLGIPKVQIPTGDPNAVTAASHTLEALTEMQAQGYRLPDSVRIVTQDRMHVAGEIVFTRRSAGLEGEVKVHRAMTIRVPERLPPGANLDDAAYVAFGGKEREGQPRAVPVMKDGKRVGWKTDLLGDPDQYDRFATRTMNDVIRHELGHVQAGHRGRALPGTEGALRAARRVSLYAASDGEDEFLAEAFTKLARGETLPADAQALYDELGGPMVRGTTTHLSGA